MTHQTIEEKLDQYGDVPVKANTPKYGGLAVLALCAAISGCAHHASANPSGSKVQMAMPSTPVKVPDAGEVCRPDIFKDGEIIKTSVGEIKVKGWRLLIDKEAVSTYFKNHPGQSLRISSSDDMGTSFIWPDNNPRRIKNGAEKYSVFGSYPRPEVDEMYLTFSLSDGSKEIEHKVYTVKMATNNVVANGVRARQIVSEVPLDDHVLEMQKFLDAMQQQNWKVGSPNVMIVDLGENFGSDERPEGAPRYGEYFPNARRILLTSNWFTEPRLKAENDGFIVFFHEYVHFFMHNLFEKSMSQEDNYAVYEAYQKLLAAAGYKAKNDGSHQQQLQLQILSDHPIFKVLREDAYTADLLKDKQKKIRIGHPNANYRELFASIVTTLRFFPDQFIKNYQGLKNSDKKVVAEVLTMVITPIGQSVSKLIPEIEKIQQACGCAD